MTGPLITIVVPIYNSEKTLSRCIDSILLQTYRTFELLLVNDGSSDRSEEVALSYCTNDSRVNYLYKENGGASSARNLGIEKACGEYVCFVDSDDTVNEDYLRLLYENIQDTDISIGNVYIEGQRPYKEILFFPGRYRILEFKKDFKNALNHVLLNSPYNKLFRMDIIKENSIQFDTSVKMGEDLLFNLAYLEKIESIAVFREIIYNYLLNDASVTKNYKKEYYSQRKVLIHRLVEFFDLEDKSDPEKQIIKVDLLLGLINNEIIENPARKADAKTLKELLIENDVLYEISIVRTLTLKGIVFRKNILMLKLGLYGLYASRLRRNKNENSV